MEQKSINIHGHKIAIHQGQCQEGPVLFLLHANSQNATLFSRQIQGELGRMWQVVAMDLPGHGASDPAGQPEVGYSLAGYRAIIRAVAQTLQPNPLIAVGHSLGGHLLMQVAEELPNLRGLLAFGSPPLAGPASFGEAFLPHPAAALMFQETLTDADLDLWARAQTHRVVNPEMMQCMREAMRLTDPRCRSHLIASLGAGEMRDEIAILRRLPVPVALLLGEQDPFVNADYCRNLDLPGLWRGAIQFLPDCGHSPHCESQARFDALLSEFSRFCLAP
ncbi:MAG: alpha/beta hydrolase [Magnetococcales bacterium]|nr:alpha/beta hydrolase [Magnetococcales bacterium]